MTAPKDHWLISKKREFPKLNIVLLVRTGMRIFLYLSFLIYGYVYGRK